MLRRFLFSTWILLAFIAWLAPISVRAQDQAPPILVLTAEGPLTPAMGEYLSRGISIAEQRGAQAIILQLDTPGGSVTLLGEMVKDMRASSVPIIVYVTPRGAMAASAGTVLTLAGHAAAMAPETTIGAASPVGSQGEDLGETLEAKTKNILKAQVRTLAEGRGPQAVKLAEDTIENAAAVSAKEALDSGLVDFIATDLNDLLRQLDGFTLQINGVEKTLHTANAAVADINPSFIEQLLATLTDPNVVFLLLTIGVQAILIEISSPGGWVAGFIGVVCLALATYGLGVLPVNWFGIIFLIVAFVLFILDIKAPTHGALTTAGVASMIVAALVLFNSHNLPGFPRVSVPLIVGTSISTGAIFFVILIFAVKAQRTPPRMGQESLAGRSGIVHTRLDPTGIVQVGGEQWTAELANGEEPLEIGMRVEVVAMQGNKMLVRKVKR
jgi:membrane-bound serine protease (ClpP class)